MSESLWEPQTDGETQTENASAPESFVTSELEAQSAADQAQPATAALSGDEFSALEERILRAVHLLKREREERAQAEAHAAQLEEQMKEQTELFDRMQKEMGELKTERDQVRQRVERLLSELDALEV